MDGSGVGEKRGRADAAGETRRGVRVRRSQGGGGGEAEGEGHEANGGGGGGAVAVGSGSASHAWRLAAAETRDDEGPAQEAGEWIDPDDIAELQGSSDEDEKRHGASAHRGPRRGRGVVSEARLKRRAQIREASRRFRERRKGHVEEASVRIARMTAEADTLSQQLTAAHEHINTLSEALASTRAQLEAASADAARLRLQLMAATTTTNMPPSATAYPPAAAVAVGGAAGAGDARSVLALVAEHWTRAALATAAHAAAWMGEGGGGMGQSGAMGGSPWQPTAGLQSAVREAVAGAGVGTGAGAGRGSGEGLLGSVDMRTMSPPLPPPSHASLASGYAGDTALGAVYGGPPGMSGMGRAYRTLSGGSLGSTGSVPSVSNASRHLLLSGALPTELISHVGGSPGGPPTAPLHHMSRGGGLQGGSGAAHGIDGAAGFVIPPLASSSPPLLLAPGSPPGMSAAAVRAQEIAAYKSLVEQALADVCVFANEEWVRVATHPNIGEGSLCASSRFNPAFPLPPRMIVLVRVRVWGSRVRSRVHTPHRPARLLPEVRSLRDGCTAVRRDGSTAGRVC